MSELIHRVDSGKQRSMGQFIQEEIVQVIGDCDYFVANYLPEQYSTRVSPGIPPARPFENQPEPRYSIIFEGKDQ